MILLSAVTIMAPVKTAEGQEQHPVRFVGTALEYVLKDSEYGWKVTVEEGTIPISMPEVVYVYTSMLAYPSGYVDPDIKPGDKVEVYGVWYQGEPLVSLVGSTDYYIKRVQGLIVVSLESETTDGKKNAGTITFGGREYSLPAYVKLTLEDLNKWYSISANHPDSYVFFEWELGGRMHIKDVHAQSTEAYVEGGGSIKAWFKLPGKPEVKYQGQLHYIRGYGAYEVIVNTMLTDQTGLKNGDFTVVNVYLHGQIIGQFVEGSLVEVYGEYYGITEGHQISVYQNYHYIKLLKSPEKCNVKYRGNVKSIIGHDYTITVTEILEDPADTLKRGAFFPDTYVTVSGQGQVIGNVQVGSFVEVYAENPSCLPGEILEVYQSYHYIKLVETLVKVIATVITADKTPYGVFVTATIEDVLQDPTGAFKKGDTTAIDAWCDSTQPACQIDWPLKAGDTIEVYGEPGLCKQPWGNCPPAGFKTGIWVGAVPQHLIKLPGGPPELNLSKPEINCRTVTINGEAKPNTPGATITRIHWNWGDGIEEDRWFPASHTYAKDGTYTISVRAYDSNGLITEKRVTVTIACKPSDTIVIAVWNRLILNDANCDSEGGGTWINCRRPAEMEVPCFSLQQNFFIYDSKGERVFFAQNMVQLAKMYRKQYWGTYAFNVFDSYGNIVHCRPGVFQFCIPAFYTHPVQFPLTLTFYSYISNEGSKSTLHMVNDYAQDIWDLPNSIQSPCFIGSIGRATGEYPYQPPSLVLVGISGGAQAIFQDPTSGSVGQAFTCFPDGTWYEMALDVVTLEKAGGLATMERSQNLKWSTTGFSFANGGTDQGVYISAVGAESTQVPALPSPVTQNILYVVLDPPDLVAHLTVFDSEDRIAGYDPDKGTLVENIPSSHTFQSDLEEYVVIVNPIDTYRLKITGFGSGDFHLSLIKSTNTGEAPNSKSIDGKIKTGESVQFTLDTNTMNVSGGESGIDPRIVFIVAILGIPLVILLHRRRRPRIIDITRRPLVIDAP